MPTLKERIENNLTVFFLATIVTGFLAGIGAYQGVLKISGQTTIAVDSKQALVNDLTSKGAQVSKLSQDIEEKTQKIAALQSELVLEQAKKPEQRWLKIRGVDGLD